MFFLNKTGKPFCFGIAFTFLFLCTINSILAQDKKATEIDSLLKLLKTARPDTNKVNLLDRIAISYDIIDRQKMLLYANQELELAQQLGWVKGQVKAYWALGQAYETSNEYQKALDYDQKGYDLAMENKLTYLQYQVLADIGLLKGELENYDQGIKDLQNAMAYFQQFGDVENWGSRIVPVWYKPAFSIGRLYAAQKKETEAISFYQQILNKCKWEKEYPGHSINI